MQKIYRIPELDALRGITAIAVILFRYTMHHNDTFSELLHFGSIGIDLFFILSGYTTFRAAIRVSNGSDFVTGRIARLYPAYWFAVTIYVFLQLGFCAIDPSLALAVQYAANVTLLQSLFGEKNIDAVYWILLVVLMFYAVIGVLIKAKLLKRIDQITSIALPLLFIYGAFGADYMGVWPVRIQRFATLVELFPLFLAGILFYKL
uniref:acyltransferase family protein n=1 Tax=Spirosoma sp. TaxID=1899569 RepID=UPI003B3BA149